MVHALTWKLVDDTAAALGVNDETRRKWRQPNRGVPPSWRIQIVEKLFAEGVSVSFADFDALPEKPGRIAA